MVVGKLIGPGMVGFQVWNDNLVSNREIGSNPGHDIDWYEISGNFAKRKCKTENKVMNPNNGDA
jgi:hypothetical protein